MKKLLIFTLLLSGVVLANNAASNTTSANRWPWSGKVDISYTLTATTTKTTPVFSVKFFGEDPDGNKFELTTLSGDAATSITLGDGQKKTTWDATADLGDDVDTSGYKIGVYAEDVTDQATYLVLDLTTYKMNTSTNGPSVAVGASSKYAELWFRRIENGTFVMGATRPSSSSSSGSSSGSIHGSKDSGFISDSSINKIDNLENDLTPPEKYNIVTNPTARQPGIVTKHTVTLSKAYYIGVFELTEGQYDRINADVTSSSAVAQDSISYDMLRGTSYGATWPNKNDHRVDATSFFGKLRTKTGNGLIFDLPTEAQWEAAARWKGTTGNVTNDYYVGGYLNNGVYCTSASNYYGLSDVAWYADNWGDEEGAHEVGLKAASTIGTYDMQGNVIEWCLDWQEELASSYVIDPEGTTSNRFGRVSRGGNCFGYAGCRIQCRIYYRDPDVADTLHGCRVALVP